MRPQRSFKSSYPPNFVSFVPSNLKEIKVKTKKFKRNEVLEVRIAKAAFGGKGIAKIETESGNLVVFVPNAIPGQMVSCRVVKSRKNHVETKLIKVLEPSKDEVKIDFQPIAGAPFATLPIALQEGYKKESSLDLMQRFGKQHDIEEKFDEYISSPNIWHYRNKMEYSFAAIRYDLNTGEELDEFALGFKHRGTWWMVENLDDDSGLFDKQVESQLHKLREFCEGSGLPPWHAPKREGFFRFLTVRKSYAEDKILFNLVTTSKNLKQFDLDGFVALLQELYGERCAGLLHTINDDVGDRVQPLDGQSKLIFGKDYITEIINGLSFNIKMESFFQTNPKSAEFLYNKAIGYMKGAVKADGAIFDLFCGTGTISQLLRRAMPDANVVGVDIEKSAIDDAKKAAALNGTDDVNFYAEDVGKFLLAHPEYAGKIDGIMLDPPRAGIAPKALKRTIELKSPVIVYISCNPATLARDTETLTQAGYVLDKFSLVDQFPHTSHVEAIALFKK